MWAHQSAPGRQPELGQAPLFKWAPQVSLQSASRVHPTPRSRARGSWLAGQDPQEAQALAPATKSSLRAGAPAHTHMPGQPRGCLPFQAPHGWHPKSLVPKLFPFLSLPSFFLNLLTTLASSNFSQGWSGNRWSRQHKMQVCRPRPKGQPCHVGEPPSPCERLLL